MCQISNMLWIDCIYLKLKLSQILPTYSGIWIQSMLYGIVKFPLNKTILQKNIRNINISQYTWGSLSDISSSMVQIFCACVIMESLSTPSGIDILDVLTY